MSAPEAGSTKPREHLANERTLLAWVRTAIALMGLGFVIARFGLFLRQLAAESHAPVPPETTWSGPIGIAVIMASVVATILSARRFLAARAQIERGAYEPEILAEAFIVAITVLGGIVLVVYLALS